MCLPNILSPVFMFAFIFHCMPLIFTLLSGSPCSFFTDGAPLRALRARELRY